jgi:mono/diheme cytochrome c family protein
MTMGMHPAIKAVALTCLALASAAVLAQRGADIGKREYNNSCAVCHGTDGKGSGAYVEFLKRTPPDLTVMSKNNGGVFPINRAYEVIQGAGPGHGTSDMPIWGQRYKIAAAEHYIDVPYNEEAFVRTRILSLVEYLSRLQAQ